jgi:cyclophilin family peptidyl-prolyl cis-trans isomerase
MTTRDTSRAPALRRRRRARWAGAVALFTFGTAAWFAASISSAPRPPIGSPAGAPPEAACGAKAPPEADPKRYEAPEQVLKKGIDYGAVIHTSCGDIELDLLEANAPDNVNSFVFLSREGFYDGLIWHRVIRQFLIESGDPNGRVGDPPDGPGYTVRDEFPAEGNDYVFGVVAMANEGTPNTGGSRFFIVTHEDEPAGLDPLYSIFGRVDDSSDSVLQRAKDSDKLGIADKATREGNDPARIDEPVVPIYIESIEITAQPTS